MVSGVESLGHALVSPLLIFSFPFCSFPVDNFQDRKCTKNWKRWDKQTIDSVG
jgi:hypothetical protein